MIPWVAKGDSQALISQCVLLKKETIIKSYIPYTLCALTLCVHLSRCNRTTCWALGQGHPPHAAFCASSSAPNPSLWLLSAALLTQFWITCTEVFCLLMYIKLNANKWGAWGDLGSGRLKVELGKKKIRVIPRSITFNAKCVFKPFQSCSASLSAIVFISEMEIFDLF